MKSCKSYDLIYSKDDNGYYVQDFSNPPKRMSRIYADLGELKRVNDIIKNLPEEFDFKANHSPWKITYHAKETEQGYEITWTLGKRIVTNTSSKEHFHRMVFNGVYLLCQ